MFGFACVWPPRGPLWPPRGLVIPPNAWGYSLVFAETTQVERTARKQSHVGSRGHQNQTRDRIRKTRGDELLKPQFVGCPSFLQGRVINLHGWHHGKLRTALSPVSAQQAARNGSVSNPEIENPGEEPSSFTVPLKE